MKSLPFLAVKDFRRFQHYRDRDPIWIKLYTNVLIDTAFLELPEPAQAQLVKLWVLASQLGNPLPNNPKLLAGKIGTTGKFFLQSIIDAGFLIPVESKELPVDSASDPGNDPLAESHNGASKTLPSTLAKSSANSSVSVPARPRSRESESESRELERETELLPPPRVRLAAAANRGLAEHEKRPQAIPRVMPNSGSTAEALETIEHAGVPVEFAESAIYELAKSHKASDQVTSLKYFAPGVVRLWDEHNASAAASASNPAGLPSTNGKRPQWEQDFLDGKDA